MRNKSLIHNIIPRTNIFDGIYRLTGRDDAINLLSMTRLGWPARKIKVSPNASGFLIVYNTDTDNYSVIEPGCSAVIPSGWLRSHRFEFYMCTRTSRRLYTIVSSSAVYDSVYSDTYKIPAELLRNINLQAADLNGVIIPKRPFSIMLDYNLSVSDEGRFCAKFKGKKRCWSSDDGNIKDTVEYEIKREAERWLEGNYECLCHNTVDAKAASDLTRCINNKINGTYGIELCNLKAVVYPLDAKMDNGVSDLRDRSIDAISASLCQSISDAAEQKLSMARQELISWKRLALSHIIDHGNLELLVQNPLYIYQLLDEINDNQ